MDALLARSLQTMRGRFESLRAHGPIPALMAETPPGYGSEWKGDLPPAYASGGWKPAAIWASALDRKGCPPAVRWVWLMGKPAAVDRLTRACVDAAGFAPSIRRHSGLSLASGAPKPEDQWVWTVFELAQRGVVFSPLQLVKRAVFVAGEVPPYIKIPEGLLARGGPSLASHGLDPALAFGPARYWELSDLVEASLMALDVFEVAISTPAKPPPTPSSASQAAKKYGKQSARKILRSLLDEVDEDGKPIGKLKIAAAGSAKGLAAMIGKKSHASVTELGDMWEKEIKPLLDTKKVIDRCHGAGRRGGRLGH